MPEISLSKNRTYFVLLCEYTITINSIKYKSANNVNSSGYFNTKGQEQSYLKRGILTLECIIHITRYSVQFKTKELLHFII